MRTSRHRNGSVYCFNELNVLQGWVAIARGYWRWHPLEPSLPLGPRKASRLDSLADAAEQISTLWPPPLLSDQSSVPTERTR